MCSPTGGPCLLVSSFLSFVGVALVLAGVVVWGIRRPKVMLVRGVREWA
jgi:hypothetical protein